MPQRSDDEPARSHHPVLADRPAQRTPVDDPALRDRRTAVEELGRALHDLVQTSVATEVDAAELRRVAAMVRDATAPLSRSTRVRGQFPTVDDLLGGIRMYNPVTGTGSAFAPPLRIGLVDGRVEATCTLGLAYEGPPTYTHGGVSAMLLDQLLGYAMSAAGRPGMTGELVCRYRRPVPLQTPLYLTAGVTEIDVDGRVAVGTATIATLADPSTVLVEATGTFVALRRETARRLFAGALDDESHQGAATPNRTVSPMWSDR